MVDIEHDALRALIEDAAVLAAQIVEAAPDDVGEGQDARGDLQQVGQQLLPVDFGQAQAAQQRVVMGQQTLDLGLQDGLVGQIAHTDRAARHLVLIGRADAATRGADLRPARGFLAGAIDQAMQRQDQRGVLGDLQHLRRDGDAQALDAGDLVHQRPGIDHHAIADNGHFTAHDARGQQRQLVDLAVDHQRMAGIVAALETHHHIGALGQPIDDLAFAFIAPLGADHRYITHAKSP